MNKQELLKALEIQRGVLKETQIHLDNIEQEIKKLDKNDFEPTPKGWIPKDGEKYHFSSSCCAWSSAPYDSTNSIHNSIIRYNRIFKTKEECKLYCEIQRAFRDASREFDFDEDNYVLHYDHEEELTYITSYTFVQTNELYFDSEETIQELINKFGEENVKRYYLEIY